MFGVAQLVDIISADGCAGRRRRGRPRWSAPRASRGRCRRRAGGGASAIASISSVAAISRFSGIVELGHQPVDILVGDVAAVLAQMGGDAVGAGLAAATGGADRIGMSAAARVPDRRDMVDVDAEAEMRPVITPAPSHRRSSRSAQPAARHTLLKSKTVVSVKGSARAAAPTSQEVTQLHCRRSHRCHRLRRLGRSIRS